MNTPLQNRTGYNQGPQGLSLTQHKFIGQPGVKCGSSDTVIFRNSPIVPGESNPRAIGAMVSGCGIIFNGTGDDIEYGMFLVDADGNEFTVIPPHVLDGTMYPITFEGLWLGQISDSRLICIPVGWSMIIRISSGNPSDGQGVVVHPWSHDMSRNLVPIMEPITTTPLVLGPPKGRGWQLAGNLAGTMQSYELANYLNFDSVERTVVDENILLAGETLKTNYNSGDNAVASDEANVALLDLIENKSKSLILAYPDKISIVGKENQTSAPLYANMNFTEFDLPRDMA